MPERKTMRNDILTLYHVECNYILEIFKKCNYHKINTAKALGISLKTLYNRLHQMKKQGRYNGEIRHKETPCGTPAGQGDGGNGEGVPV